MVNDYLRLKSNLNLVVKNNISVAIAGLCLELAQAAE